MNTIKVDHKRKALVFSKDTVIDNQYVYNFFSKVPENKRLDFLSKAIHIGVLALMEERFAAFLARTKNELGVELENLKQILDTQTIIFNLTAIKGKYAEKDILKIMNDYFDQRDWPDYANFAGDNEGKYKNVKTGDILCFPEGRDDLPIVLEIKFSKSLPLGDLTERDLVKNTNNIWGQLIESKANREAKAAMIVFDTTISQDLYQKLGPTTFIPNVGYVVFVDSQRNDFTPLLVTYNIARSFVLSNMHSKLKPEIIVKLVNKLSAEISKIDTIRGILETNIKNNQKAIDKLEAIAATLTATKEFAQALNEESNQVDELFYHYFTGTLKTS